MKIDCEKIHELAANLASSRGELSVMEVCGTHTMAIAASGLRSLLPETLRLISGPGCPVCVTDQSYIDRAIWLARKEDVVVATYGDMVRVPGREGSLADARARGAAVEVVYSANQAVSLAAKMPDRQIVFLAVGFETTTPGTAMAILRAREESIDNFFAFTAHKLMLPAMRALLEGGRARIDGFLCPGHVAVILGWEAFGEISDDFSKPCVVAGFDPSQIAAGIGEILSQLAAGQAKACSVYSSVSAEGNAKARRLMSEVFVETDADWRALGVISGSGLTLRESFAKYDAARQFTLPETEPYQAPGCRCGEVITGICGPHDCGLFAKSCTPRNPVGPCMVSSEGACAAAYKYEKR